MRKVKNKKCRVCRGEFKPFSSTQIVCGTPCAVEWQNRQKTKDAKRRAKFERDQRRKAREKLKTRREWVSDTQKIFNSYIRERDKHLPCISCDSKPNERRMLLTGSRWDCGHYRSVGSCPELRFEELNAHKQCVRCNQHLSGNTVEYRIRLIDRIGQENVDWLEGKHELPKYTIDDLKALIKHFKQKIRDLKEQRDLFKT